MKKDKIKIFFLEMFLVIITIFVLLNSNIISTFFVSIILGIYMVLVCAFQKLKKIQYDQKNQVTFLLIILGIIYLSAFYLMGIIGIMYAYNVVINLYSIIPLKVNLVVI